MFFEGDTSIDSNKKARPIQIYRKEMSLLCKVSENEINLNNNGLGHKGKGRRGRWLEEGEEWYCAQRSLQIRPSESLNVCE